MLEVLLGTTGQLGELILRTGHDQILLRAGLPREAWRAVRIRGISTRLANERYGSDRPRAAESRPVGESASPSGERGGSNAGHERPLGRDVPVGRSSAPIPRTVPAPAASRVGVVVPGD